MGRSLSEFVYYEGIDRDKKRSERISAFLKSEKYVLPVLVGFLLVNAVVVDIILFGSKTSTSSPGAASSSFCSENCISDIMSKVSSYIKATTSSTSSDSGAVNLVLSPSATPTLTLTPTDTPVPTDTPIPTSTPTSAPTVKEFFVPLGQGSGSSGDWTVVPGMEAKIDPANYGQIDKVYFEATIRIPTGNQTVYLRLYNSNNYQSIAGSELTLSGGTTTLLVSSPISLHSGNNLYQIQLKTQLKFLTYIDQARIRIQTK